MLKRYNIGEMPVFAQNWLESSNKGVRNITVLSRKCNCSEPLRFLNVPSEIPCRIALRRWDFLTLDLLSYGLGRKCLDLPNSYQEIAETTDIGFS